MKQFLEQALRTWAEQVSLQDDILERVHENAKDFGQWLKDHSIIPATTDIDQLYQDYLHTAVDVVDDTPDWRSSVDRQLEVGPSYEEFSLKDIEDPTWQQANEGERQYVSNDKPTRIGDEWQ